MYIYVGKCPDGKYWFIKSSWIYNVVKIGGKVITKIYAKLTDVVKDRKLWESLPSKVRKTLEEIGIKPTWRRTVTQDVNVDWDAVKTLWNVIKQFTTSVREVLCPRCLTRVDKLWKSVAIELTEVEPEYVHDLDTVENVARELECTLRLSKC